MTENIRGLQECLVAHSFVGGDSGFWESERYIIEGSVA